MRKMKILRFAYSVVSICFLFLIASCSREVLDSGFNNDIEPDSEFAHTVSIDEAEEQLLEILNDLQGIETRGSEKFVPRRIVSRFSSGSPIPTKAEGEIEPYVHVFNFEDSTGFAIMSGDDRVPHLLALTFDGELSPGTEVDNPGLIIFLANMEEYYKSLIDLNITANESDSNGDPSGPDPNEPDPNDQNTSEIDNSDGGSGGSSRNRDVYGSWRTVTYSMVNGHCNVQWGQDKPYNLYCPVEDGKNTLTGCVATAVAQLMSAYEYPSSYGGYTFDWSEMNKHINTANEYQPAHDQIARLMQQLGLSNNLDVNYGLSSSSAYPSKIPGTLINFGFSNGGKLISYDTDDIVSELKSGFYTLIVGFSSRTVQNTTALGITTQSYDYSGGHIWLAHGLMQRVRTISTYSSSGTLISQSEESLWYPLCNFGWNGSKDGYYLSGVFDTNTGPEYEWDGPDTRSNVDYQNTKSEGTSYNYQFNMKLINEIRK